MTEQKDNSALSAAVKALPEIYQPIYGHDEWNTASSRKCEDRLSTILKLCEILQKSFGRPIRVLDLGCAQGFFSLNIASLGGGVVGVDLLPANINVCKILAAEHPDYKVEFVNARIENVIVNLQKNQFDLVLGLSVFHHLCVAYGWQNVAKLLAVLAEKVPFGIFELALKEEKVHWATALPEKYRDLLTGFNFTKLLAYNETHLTEVKRPLLLASNYFVYDEKIGFLKIDSVKKIAHDYQPAEDRVRKYFICGNVFVKHIVKLFDWENREVSQEINFLREMGGKKNFPKLLSASVTSYGNDVEFFIAREKLDGVLLSDKIMAGENYDAWSIIKQILQQLVYLESQGYYYDDLRVWNVLYNNNSGKAYLIDYGAIGRTKRDIFPPYDLRIVFFRFMNEVFDRNYVIKRPVKFLTALKKHIPTELYKKILSMKVTDDFFAQLYKILFETRIKSDRIEEFTLAELELIAVENLVDTLIEP